MLAHCKQVFVCHVNIVHFIVHFILILSLYLNIWHSFGVVQSYQFEVTLNIYNHNSIGWNIRGFLEQYIKVASVDSLYEPDLRLLSMHLIKFIQQPCPLSHLPYIRPSNLPYTLQSPLSLTLIVLAHWPAISIKPSSKYIPNIPCPIPRTDTTTAFDQCGILNLYLLFF